MDPRGLVIRNTYYATNGSVHRMETSWMHTKCVLQSSPWCVFLELINELLRVEGVRRIFRGLCGDYSLSVSGLIVEGVQ